MPTVHTRVIPVFVKSCTSRRSAILQEHEPVPDRIEETDLLSCFVHDGIIDDFISAGYEFSGAASKSRTSIFKAERQGQARRARARPTWNKRDLAPLPAPALLGAPIEVVRRRTSYE
jgi:hypothetical protein